MHTRTYTPMHSLATHPITFNVCVSVGVKFCCIGLQWAKPHARPPLHSLNYIERSYKQLCMLHVPHMVRSVPKNMYMHITHVKCVLITIGNEGT